MIGPWVSGGFSTEAIIAELTSIMAEAYNTSIAGVVIDIESFTTVYMPPDPALQGDWELWLEANISGNGTIKPDEALHSAMRHCYASALLSARVGCRCAGCIGDWREYPDIWAGLQPLRNTQAQLYNNWIGRKCAGCVNKRVVTTLGSWSVWPPTNIFDPPVITVDPGFGGVPTSLLPVQVPGFKSKDDMLKCCIGKAKNGGLDIAVENTDPDGAGNPVIAIPPNPNR